MKTYKNYTQEGNVYHLKQFSTAYFFLIIFGLFLLYAAFFIIEDTGSTGGIISILCGLFCIAAVILRMGGKFVIDKNRRTVFLKRTSLAKEREFAFEDFSRFYVMKYSYFGFLTTNVMGDIYFLENGKEKGHQLKQTFFSAKPVQRVIDETAEIMEIQN